MFPLGWIVNADENLRGERLIEHRGFSEQDARARIAAQGHREQRRAVAECGSTTPAAQGSWSNRRVRCGISGSCRSRHNLDGGEPARLRPVLVPYDTSWRHQARRIAARMNTACGIGPFASTTSDRRQCRGWTPRTSSTVQVTVASLDAADGLTGA